MHARGFTQNNAGATPESGKSPHLPEHGVGLFLNTRANVHGILHVLMSKHVRTHANVHGKYKHMCKMCTESRCTHNPARVNFTHTRGGKASGVFVPGRGRRGSWCQWLSSCSKRPATMGGLSTRVPFFYWVIRSDCGHSRSFSAPPHCLWGCP